MPSLAFNPRAWYWLVGGDTAQAWSSAAGAYVTAYPADRVTHIDSEASLPPSWRPMACRGRSRPPWAA